MKHNLLITYKYLFPIAIIGFAVIVLGAILKITHFSFYFFTGNSTLLIGSTITMLVWSVVFIDILRNNVKNSFMWIILMFLLGNLAPLLYLINRKNLE